MSANAWRHKQSPHDGPPRLFFTRLDAVAKEKGDPCVIAGNLAVIAGDGDSVDLVIHQDADASSTDVLCIIPHGDIFEVRVATGTDLSDWADVFMAATRTVDAGAANQQSCGFVVNGNPDSGGCALIAVTSARWGIRNYGA